MVSLAQLKSTFICGSSAFYISAITKNGTQCIKRFPDILRPVLLAARQLPPYGYRFLRGGTCLFQFIQLRQLPSQLSKPPGEISLIHPRLAVNANGGGGFVTCLLIPAHVLKPAAEVNVGSSTGAQISHLIEPRPENTFCELGSDRI